MAQGNDLPIKQVKLLRRSGLAAVRQLKIKSLFYRQNMEVGQNPSALSTTTLRKSMASNEELNISDCEYCVVVRA